MRVYKYIIGFITVSFVLVFQGKINKIDLYKAFFIAIQDVEVRNSHGLSLTAVLGSDYYFEDEVNPNSPNGGLLALASQPDYEVYPPASNQGIPASQEIALPFSIALLLSSPTRAP